MTALSWWRLVSQSTVVAVWLMQYFPMRGYRLKINQSYCQWMLLASTIPCIICTNVNFLHPVSGHVPKPKTDCCSLGRYPSHDKEEAAADSDVLKPWGLLLRSRLAFHQQQVVPYSSTDMSWTSCNYTCENECNTLWWWAWVSVYAWISFHGR